MHTQSYIHNHTYTIIHTQSHIHNHTYTIKITKPYINNPAYTAIHTQSYIHNHTYTITRKQSCINNHTFTAIYLQCICNHTLDNPTPDRIIHQYTILHLTELYAKTHTILHLTELYTKTQSHTQKPSRTPTNTSIHPDTILHPNKHNPTPRQKKSITRLIKSYTQTKTIIHPITHNQTQSYT